MAISTCIKCGKSSFEIVEKEPFNSEFKLNFVQCSSCGGVVGVLDYFNTGELVMKLAEKLNVHLER